VARTTTEELKKSRLAAITADERAAFNATFQVTQLAVDIGEKVCSAREGAGDDEHDDIRVAVGVAASDGPEEPSTVEAGPRHRPTRRMIQKKIR
jgi:hypothetical protein